jgi:hypothetical protein
MTFMNWKFTSAWLAKYRALKGAGLQRMQLHRPPACARFLLGGTCDKVPTVFDNYGFREAVWRKVLWSTCPAKASRLIRLWRLRL